MIFLYQNIIFNPDNDGSSHFRIISQIQINNIYRHLYGPRLLILKRVESDRSFENMFEFFFLNAIILKVRARFFTSNGACKMSLYEIKALGSLAFLFREGFDIVRKMVLNEKIINKWREITSTLLIHSIIVKTLF